MSEHGDHGSRGGVRDSCPDSEVAQLRARVTRLTAELEYAEPIARLAAAWKAAEEAAEKGRTMEQLRRLDRKAQAAKGALWEALSDV